MDQEDTPSTSRPPKLSSNAGAERYGIPTYYIKHDNWPKGKMPSINYALEKTFSRKERCTLAQLRCHGHSYILSSFKLRTKKSDNDKCVWCKNGLDDLQLQSYDAQPPKRPARCTWESTRHWKIFGNDRWKYNVCYEIVTASAVNSIEWSEDGLYLLSGSDDQKLVITNAFTNKNVATILSGHRSNIFCAKFLPCCNSKLVVSCAGDGTIILTDVDREDTHAQFIYNCHICSTYELATIQDNPFCFLSCAEDGTVRYFDRRMKTSCLPCQEDVLFTLSCPTTAIDVNKRRPYQLGVGCADGTARVYDLRKLSRNSEKTDGFEALNSFYHLDTPQTSAGRNKRVTSLDFSPDGQCLLISFSCDDVYLVDFNNVQIKQNDTFFDEISAGQSGKKATGQSKRKVRLRGDWMDTGPDASTEAPSTSEGSNNVQEPSTADATNRAQQNLGELSDRMTNLLRVLFAERQLDDNETERAGPSQGHTDQPSMSGEETVESIETSEPLSVRKAKFQQKFLEHVKARNEQEKVKLVHRLKSIPQMTVINSFTGHRNARTMLKQACFWGTKFIMSGSECGNFFVWDRYSGKVVCLYQADGHVVNCLQPNPFFPILATSGIDYDVKVWGPVGEAKELGSEYMEKVIKRNTELLVESSDTITVPARFMLRMLAAASRTRSGNGGDDNPSRYE